ncbi:MAG TPA: glycogen debranching N-terminal domain-containing protein [Candidatus Limnocylindria bacterium]|nr:glycogen debranching N-terminal domain-containing protein [Candidatus Limnocylindria bacterium]
MSVSLKEDELVLITEDDGSLPVAATSPLGLYYHDTQFLSGYKLRVNGAEPVLLSANTEQNYVATFQLMHSEGATLGQARHAAKTLSIRRTRFLADGLRERVGILNANPTPLHVTAELEFEVAFRDMFAVRGYQQTIAEGTPVTVEPRADGLVFERVGRDGVRRTSEVSVRPAPDAVAGNTLRIERDLAPQQALTIELAVIPREDGAGEAPSPARFDEALDALNARYLRFLRSCARYETSSETLDEGLIARSALDLRALLEFHEGGPFPTGGIPWYAVPFGRDALITAYETLAWNPDLARGTLRLLARYQGQKVDEFTEEEPGKIFHELRRGELARLKEIPHRPYFGSVDATPLFALVFAETVKWTADRALWRELLPAAERALTWCDGPHGDVDRDGYVEYGTRDGARTTPGHALRSQGWKDSAESLSDRDGALSDLPAALVEVQAYVYAAKRGIADLYALDGDEKRADRLRGEARELQERFERDFWMPDESCYAQALDAHGQQVPAVTSNAAHALWAGIASPDRAAAVVRRLMAPDMYTGWGLRTLSSRYPTYNPMSYHNGSVWPHDSAIAAHGMARYGFREEANEVVSGLIEAGRRFPNARLPELFCGFQRDLRFSARPADYLVSCIPQAWSAGMVFLNLRTLLGMAPDLSSQRLILDPALPAWLERIDVRDLRLFDTTLSFRVRRGKPGASDLVTGARGRVRRARTASPA